MNILETLEEHGFWCGRMISGSKTRYIDRYPYNIVYFNANIITINDGKIWYGDLDITVDGESLKAIAESCGETLYILRETDARFGSEDESIIELIKKSVWNTTQVIPIK